MWSSGDAVLVRSVRDRCVRRTFPQRLVSERDGTYALYLAPGTPGKLTRRNPGGRYLERWITDEPSYDHVWARNHILKLVHLGGFAEAIELGVFTETEAAAV